MTTEAPDQARPADVAAKYEFVYTPSPDEWGRIHVGLAAPFPDEDVGSVTIDKKSGLQGRYITARSVMDRLDEVVGPGNWADDYEVWDQETCAVKCTITVFGISRSDVGYPNDPSDAEGGRREPLKAACSDALKRAGVHWGIGRYLYPKPGERGKASPDAARGGGGYPASEKQINFLRRLAGNNGVNLPNRGNLTGLPGPVASQWIDELQTKGPAAVLTGWPPPGAPLTLDSDAGPETEFDEFDAPPQEDTVQRRQQTTPPQAASPQKPASANQLATILKLSRLLGEPEEPGEDTTSAEASGRITELSREYNSRKAAAGRPRP